jgi:hypothetical protein
MKKLFCVEGFIVLLLLSLLSFIILLILSLQAPRAIKEEIYSPITEFVDISTNTSLQISMNAGEVINITEKFKRHYNSEVWCVKITKYVDKNFGLKTHVKDKIEIVPIPEHLQVKKLSQEELDFLKGLLREEIQ